MEPPMKNALFFLAALCTLAQPVFALVNVGQKPKNYCWKDIADKTICLEDAALADRIITLADGKIVSDVMNR